MAGLPQHEAIQLLAKSIAEIVGRDSEAYRDILRAIESEAMMDLMLAQSSFDALPGDMRKQIAERVNELVNRHTGQDE